MKNTMNFTAKTVIFALFAFFLSGSLFAANASTDGCHKLNGCSSGASYNGSAYSGPTYAPSWTEVTTSGRVKRGDYLIFSVVEGEVYQWSTEGQEDVFAGEYSTPCNADTQCAANYEISAGTGLRCIDNYCLLPFDTELTLIDGTACSNTANFLAYSNSNGYRNQSQLEWKATFTGNVTLLVTNYQYNYDNGDFENCKKHNAADAYKNVSTTVKWRRTASEHCDVCGVSEDFKIPTTAGDADDVAKAPLWTAVQEYSATSSLNVSSVLASMDSWIKPGSYLTFEVKENEIYRWSTCKSTLHDTQLTLFKGDVNNSDGQESCGEFLAYGDDSKVSYVANAKTYCPAGTKQTVLEWQANFTGPVTLLFSEYNCYQCAPQKNPATGANNWLSCFDTVVGTYKATVNDDGTKTVVTDSDGFPIVASSSCNPSSATAECVTASYIYTYPLHWQRYDCQTCSGEAAKIADYTTDSSGWNDFAGGGSQELTAGKYVAFSLTRGSKYLFKSTNPSSIITIKKGTGCGGETIAQGTGELAYFANSDDYDSDEGTFSPDLISVYVSDSDCNANANTLSYSYYGTGGNLKTRFTETKYGNDVIITDNTTGLQFADTGEWVDSWQKAIKKCQTHTVGGSTGSGAALNCPERICPNTENYSSGSDEDDFCSYLPAQQQCDAPVCSSNDYTEYVKTNTNKNDEDKQDLFGRCYYRYSYEWNGSRGCNATSVNYTNATNPTCHGSTQAVCESDETFIQGNAVGKRCCKCTDGKVLNQGKCYNAETTCKPLANQFCVGREVGCNDGAVKEVCPDGYTEQSDGTCLDEEGTNVYNMYSDISDVEAVEAECEGGSCLVDDGEEETCPEGTYRTSSGACEYTGCYPYANGGKQTSISFGSDNNGDYDTFNGKDVWADHTSTNPSSTVPMCYSSCSSYYNNIKCSGTRKTCCCDYDSNNSVKKAYYDSSLLGGSIEYYEYSSSNPLIYATAYNPNGTVSAIDEWRCEHVDTCESKGFTKGDDGHCYKCEQGTLRKGADGEYHCYEDCPAGSTFKEGKCYTCAGGTSYDVISDPYGDGYACFKSCTGGYREGTGLDAVCHMDVTDKVNACDREAGWVQDPSRPDLCKRIYTSTTPKYNYVLCSNSSAELKDESAGKTCDTSKPNSYDCDCYYNRCENTERTEDDAKKCPEKVSYMGTCQKPNGVLYKCQKTTNVTTVWKTVELNGVPIQVAGSCTFSDATTGQACGKALGGWTLPNINQLYSIVDFDLYDPATAYPDLEYSRGTPNSATCEKTESTNAACDPNDEDPCNNEYLECINNKCVTTDPFGDLKCKKDGSFLCDETGHCVRNNWFWSNNTVVSENANSAKFTWAVNMEDGRSYRALKGCVGEACDETVDATARRHRVICIKGASVAGIFDNDAPSSSQTFSGWACDKDNDAEELVIYFEIVDNSQAKKDVVAMLPASDFITQTTIPGGENKGIIYGKTDIKPANESQKGQEIYNNCNFKSNPAKHAFEIKWNGEVTEGKDEIADLIMSIADIQCSDEVIKNYYDTTVLTKPDVSNCAMPPYFVTAYGLNESSTSASAVAIAPTYRPFVIKNVCGDGYQTFDGNYAENCESSDFNKKCVYGSPSCSFCTQQTVSKDGEVYKPCQFYPADVPDCHDGKIQSYYCENGVIADGNIGARLSCEYYDFAADNKMSSSEQCDGPADHPFYYYEDPDNFDISHPLEKNICPYYNSTRTVFTSESALTDDDFCYICSGCQRSKTPKAYCGDGTTQRSDCTGYLSCEVVAGADEECDTGAESDTGKCTSKCKNAVCGDKVIQPENGEICDSGNLNGHYATHCNSEDIRCPGCASFDCGTGGENDGLGPRCGDGKIQNESLCTASNATLVANGYADQAEFFAMYGFKAHDGKTAVQDCQEKLAGAAEVCDLGIDEATGKSKNGVPVTFEDFLDTTEGADCAQKVHGILYPVNAVHANYAECIYKYKQFVEAHPGCSADCSEAKVPYCGDKPGCDKDNLANCDGDEKCDNGLPTVTYSNGQYTIAASSSGYNGKMYGSCRLDCKDTYHCDDNIKEEENCVEKDANGFCKNVGTYDSTSDDSGSGVTLYVKNGKETCDEGEKNGTYGHCDNCSGTAKCGNGIINDIKAGKREECDYGGGSEGNQTLEKAYSMEYGQSCVAEEGCDGEYETWGDKNCCVYGRYCGDGTVDNGTNKNFDTWVGKSGVSYNPAANWTLEGAEVEYDIHNYALLFTLTGDEATVTFNTSYTIDPALRYFMELDLMILPTEANEAVSFDAGAREYNDSSAEIATSPFYFVDIYNPSGTYVSGKWYHGRNVTPIKGLGTATYNWGAGTKTAKVVFHMEGTEGTRFKIRSFSFYDLENVSYKGDDESQEMCDPGDGNFATSSNSYMTDCEGYLENGIVTGTCKWINYCGDGTVQRSGNDCVGGKYNGYDCVGGISGAAEICDKGEGNNIANTYNGCEPGCLEIGPHCGDGVVDCATNNGTCHYAKGMSVSEQCDQGTGTCAENPALCNNETALTGERTGATAANYGTCRTNCKFSRCGDGVFDEGAYTIKNVPKTDEYGNILYEMDGDHFALDANGNKIPQTEPKPVMLEECDCGEPGSYDPAVTGNYQVNLNAGKEGVPAEWFDICRRADGTAVYNTNNEKRKAVCRPNCTISKCGDGILDKLAGEECDDGNDNDHDSCKNDCTFAQCNDGILAFTRSYLCEELVGMNGPALKELVKKGIVDCDGYGSSSYTCAQLAGIMTTNAAVADKFDEGVLHCCYNTKLREGGEGDHNCEFLYVDTTTSAEVYKTPKELAVQYCKDNAVANEVSSSGCGSSEQIERCEYCKDKDCGCSELYPEEERTTDALKKAYKKCLENNKYCIHDMSSKQKCWNIFGSCGDGKIDPDEECDDFSEGLQGTYTDLDGELQNGLSEGIGTYCTGTCSSGSCTYSSPRCTAEGQANCWTTGCARKRHTGNDDVGGTGRSKCGDGKIDAYATNSSGVAIEECDDGDAQHSNSATEAYCSKKCKKNTYGSGYARCGDGQIQSLIEACDDGNTADGDYCVNSCRTSYGSCGDGELHGVGFNYYDSKSTLSAPNGSDGPEYCDFKDFGGGTYKGDPRSVSLYKAGVDMADYCSNCGVDNVPFTCGDKNRNLRFEGCDFSTTNKDNTVECTSAIAVSSDGSSDDFGACTTKSIGRKCYKGCTSDAFGGLIQAASFGIYGWACDPDHPMTHEAGFVTLRFYNKNNNELTGSPITLKTDRNFGGDLINGTDTNGYAVDQNFTVKACGGGEKHGWFFDPSLASGVVFENGPYTVKAYAKSLDPEEVHTVGSETVPNMTLLGEASFAMMMFCGDKVVSKCSDITVQVKDVDEHGNPTARSVTWDDGMYCADSQIYGGKTCADYGLVNGRPCVSEKCDNGLDFNGAAYDCGSDCQWTKCGDGTTQDKAGQGTGITFRPAANKAKPADPEECDGNTKECSALLADKPITGLENEIKNTASCTNTSSNKCKWNVACKVESKCPPLSTADMLSGSEYKKAASTYIRYVNGSNPKYTRTWNGDFATGSWPAAQTKVVYKDDAADDIEAKCAFECVDGLKWNGSKCVGKESNTYDCGSSQCPDYSNGIWVKWGDSSTENKACYGGTANPTVTYGTEINSTTGEIVWYHKNGSTKEYYTNNTIPAVYGTAVDGKNCVYRCPSDSVYGPDSSNKMVCQKNSITHTCKVEGDRAVFTYGDGDGAENKVWVKVWKTSAGVLQIRALGNGDKLENVGRHLNAGCGNTGVDCYYEPSTTDLTAYEINHSQKGIIAQKSVLTVDDNNYATAAAVPDSVPTRCFYTCAEGYELQIDGSCKKPGSEAQCGGRAKIHSEHCDLIEGTGMAGYIEGSASTKTQCVFAVGAKELCDDGASNGKYGKKAVDGKSYCKTDCGKGDSDAFLQCVANHPSDWQTACTNGQYGRIGGGTEYFCGDSVVQITSSDSKCQGLNCKTVNSSNYPGATLTDFSTYKEQCDGSADRNKLCNRWLALNSVTTTSSSYYNNTNLAVGCGTDCTISGITSSNYPATCGFCGDGKVQRASAATGVSADFANVANASEKCDKSINYANDAGTVKLCNAALGLSRSSYYTPSTRPTCNSDCQGISNATQGTNCKWCGDGYVTDGEKCDGTVSATCYSQRANSGHDCSCDHGDGCKTCYYYDWYNVSCSSCQYTKTSNGNVSDQTSAPSGTNCASYGL